MRRRELLAGLAATAAVTVRVAGRDPRSIGQVLVDRLRDAMLGLGGCSDVLSPERASAELDLASADFRGCRYSNLAVRLPRLISSGGGADAGVLARSYLLAARLLIKLDESQLGWLAADRAHHHADDPVTTAEAARNLSILARKAGWHDQALTIALTAAGDDRLRTAGPGGIAQRGLLIQSAAYTVARSGDRAGMRQLTAEAAAIAAALHGSAVALTPVTVQLHRISAENSTGDPSAALRAAAAIDPAQLPSVERTARYFTDVAVAWERWGRRDECVRALLAAERHAPEETRSRPAVRSLIAGLLASGRITFELRSLAARAGVLD